MEVTGISSFRAGTQLGGALFAALVGAAPAALAAGIGLFLCCRELSHRCLESWNWQLETTAKKMWVLLMIIALKFRLTAVVVKSIN